MDTSLNIPCGVKLIGQEGATGKTPFKLRLTPWMPLSKDETISVVADWVISITEPIDDLKETYEQGIAGYEQREDSDSDDESNTDQSD